MIQALYVHVPFCDDICSYCDFVRVKTHDKLIEPYLHALYQELQTIDQRHMNTIYVGGGTPSALSDEQLETLFEMLKPFTTQIQEYTIEMNPESLTEKKAEICQNYHVNRVSFGVQSFDADELKLLNRHHDVQMIEAGIDLLHKVGINNISIDLIYGLPQQSLETWKANLEQALQLDVQHISLYALTIEENSLFGRTKTVGVAEELEEDMYFYAVERLAQAGFKRYEISNFTKDQPSKHNLHYWRMSEYKGVGPGAVSYVDHRRIENTANLMDYAAGKFHKSITPLTQQEEEFEMIMMSLRMQVGLSRHAYQERFTHDVYENHKKAIDEGLSRGWLTLNDTHLTCTQVGLGLLHNVLLLFME